MLDRRTLLRAGLAASGAGLLSACTSDNRTGAGLILPSDPRIQAVEAQRRTAGRTATLQLTAQVAHVDLGRPEVTTWTYGGVLPGNEIRIHAGDIIRVTLTNQLPADTTIHWHRSVWPGHCRGLRSVLGGRAHPAAGRSHVNAPCVRWLRAGLPGHRWRGAFRCAGIGGSLWPHRDPRRAGLV